MTQVLDNKRPDLLILDCMMPGKTGIEVLRQIRGSKLSRRIPVLMLTGRGSRSDREIAFYTGADDYISKPFDSEELALRVNALIERGSRIAPLPSASDGSAETDEKTIGRLIRL